ncbi:MAG TPA: hypothetical protein VGK04_09460 [Thermoanaerobaculia bacterium]
MHIRGSAALVIVCVLYGTSAQAQIDWGRVKSDPTFGDVRKQHPVQTTPREKERSEQARAKQESKQEREAQEARERRYLAALTQLKLVENIPEEQQYPVSGRIEPKPAGTILFGSLRHSGEELESVLDEIDFDLDKAFVRSTTTAEDAYRALYLMQAARDARGWEDARFLADQAALAMDRERILVVVPSASRTTETNRKIEAFLTLQKKVEERKVEFREAREERRRIEQVRKEPAAAVQQAKVTLAEARSEARRKLPSSSENRERTAPVSEKPKDEEEDDLVKRAKAQLAKTTQTLAEIDEQLQRAAKKEAETRKELAESLRQLAAL